LTNAHTENTIDLHADQGQRWTLRDNREVEEVLRAWGATECERVTQERSAYQVWMARGADGFWRYAHSDGVSVYQSDREFFQAPDGQTAYAMHELAIAEQGLANRREGYLDQIEEVERLRRVIRQRCEAAGVPWPDGEAQAANSSATILNEEAQRIGMVAVEDAEERAERQQATLRSIFLDYEDGEIRGVLARLDPQDAMALEVFIIMMEKGV
jgi:hypothetical protein